MEEFHINILNICAVLLSAYLGGILIRKVGYPAILGELLVGIVLGPGLLGVLQNTESIKVLAEIGIILLMVYIGMEIDFHDLKKASWPGFLAAIGGFFVPFFLGYFVIVMSGGSAMAGLFVAIGVGVTSLATKSRILIDLNLLNTRIAYVLLTGALISDTLALIIFAGITNFAEASVIKIKDLIFIGGKIILFFIVTISIGIYILPRIGNYLSRAKKQSSTVYFTLILIVVFAYCELAEMAGMHNILGAFMAGLFLKKNLFRKSISQELHKAFYDVSIGFMAPVFFVSAGFFVDISVFKTDLVLLLIIVLVATLGKIVGTVLFYFPSGNGWREGLAIGTGMNGRGAVEIIIAGIGLEMGIIDKSIFSILVFTAIFTTLTVPVFLSWTTNWLRKRNELVYVSEKHGVLILGINPLSLLIGSYISKNQVVTFLDNNRELVEVAKQKGFNTIYGNIFNEDLMEESMVDNTSSFLGFTTNSEVNLLAAQLASRTFLIPDVFVTNIREESMVDAHSLDDTNLKSMLSSTSLMNTWVYHIRNNEYGELEETIQDNMTCLEWLKHKNLNKEQFLPFVINTKSGDVIPFYLEGDLIPGDKVLLLRTLTEVYY